jgi:hypothetical protein
MHFNRHEEIAMSKPAQSFPAFDEWEKMSESEQDALLDRMETTKERGSTIKRVVMVLLSVAVYAATCVMVLTLRP